MTDHRDETEPHTSDVLARWDDDLLARLEREEPSVSSSSPFFSRPTAPLAKGGRPADARTGDRIGDFELQRLLGRGGMGQVWLARQHSLAREVALKLVLPERVSEETLELFGREARAGARLAHPGLVTVYEHGTSDGVAWIAMEVVEGNWTLRDFLDHAVGEGKLPPDYYTHVAVFVKRTAEALHYAHEAGVIHRDLKPRNILISPEDRPRVTDFGLARIADETALSRSGDVAGTYAYMSPEQLAGHRSGVDHRTDVFSLGVVLYELLALRRPFLGDTSQQLARQIALHDPPDPRHVRSRVPDELAVVCLKCLEKSPERRYSSMAEFALDLDRFLRDEPIRARQPGRWRKVRLWARRNPVRAAASAITAASVAVIAVLLWSTLQSADLLAKEVASVKRLSALQDYEDLIERADALWPAHPQNIGEYEKWIDDATRLVADLPLHRAKRDELRAGAQSPSDRERVELQRRHPGFAELREVERELASKRAARSRRADSNATAVPSLPELDWGELPKSAEALYGRAWFLVDPDREWFGREAEGVAMASRALELAEEDLDDPHVAGAADVLAHGWFALGCDDAAREASELALGIATGSHLELLERRAAELVRWIDEAESPGGLSAAAAEIERLEVERDALLERLDQERDWVFPSTPEGREERWWHANLTELVRVLEGLEAPSTGLVAREEDAVSPEHGWSVPRRLAFALRERERHADDSDWTSRWDEAAAAIATHVAYRSMELAPQAGLVPLGPDPVSGLWEFAHVATGMPPTRGTDGALVMEEGSALVLVLLPGGTFRMGAQAIDSGAPQYDPKAKGLEGPVHDVELSPFFVSKYEMTQGQWLRFVGHNPSSYKPPSTRASTLLHPVEQVSWLDTHLQLGRMGLELPTEAQWEYACRAGTTTPWWTGAQRDSLRQTHAVNLADRAAARTGAPWVEEIADWPELDDGYVVHAPIGTFAANGFGLHEMPGNLWEWCLDGYDAGYFHVSPRRDPLSRWDRAEWRVHRGSSYRDTASSARSSGRRVATPGNSAASLGVRPARAIEGTS